MSQAVRDWLPIGAASGELVRSTVTRAIVQWSERWFASGGLGVGSVSAVAGGDRAGGDGDDWRVYRAQVAVRYSPAMASRLLERALAMRYEGAAFTDNDRRLLASFTQRMFEDLASCVEEVLDVEGELRESPELTPNPLYPLGGALVRFSDGRDQLLALAIPLQTIAALYKARLPKTQDPRARLTSLRAALRPSDLVLEARVGHASVSMQELRSLERGDIIVLDRRVDQGGEIALPTGGPAIARAEIAEDGGKLALKLQAFS